MLTRIAWKVGGEQGEGIDSTGDILATVACRLGYWAYGYRHFSSRIKGGHTHFTVRIATAPVSSPTDECHMLVAFGQETIDRAWREMVPGGLVLADASFKPAIPSECPGILLPIPLTDIARELGNVVMRNMVALGATAAFLGMPLEPFKEYARQKFGRKGAAVVQPNIDALQRGYDFTSQNTDAATRAGFRLASGDGKNRLLMTGNEALSLGALAAGCRIFAGYPITPASEIMETLQRWFPRYGGVVCQMEDELASIAMIIGAGFAGVRAMTSTSGPGVSLMQEAIGLAAMTETPCVIVDCQRSGPSTGMPTKQEQSDILGLIYGGHGESPRIVLAPATAEDAFYDAALAFNLAERYQTPVIIASDLAVALWKQTIDELDLDQIRIERGPMISSEELLRLGRDRFQRYAGDGVSPRSIPGQKHGQFLATGAEHNPFGKVSEDPRNRVRMMRKRLGKLADFDVPGVRYFGDPQPELLLIGFGSTQGAIEEARERLAAEGYRTGHAHLRVLNPLPTAELQPYLASARAAVVVEQNATAQLLQLMRARGLETAHCSSCLKYDGTLLLPVEVADVAREAMPLATSAAD